ncbi:RING finger protein nhl-1 [Porphyridium purpureum]|uniref:RING finger protein nhl-1 n=1 Tax=Porphyridium purpureum TaxID=35688 RepID=A0A5J4YVD4_PORPP|nr:RING finger protein nhl-1 [Porphyridium purpureum]|eukprot:POR1969..scf209_3
MSRSEGSPSPSPSNYAARSWHSRALQLQREREASVGAPSTLSYRALYRQYRRRPHVRRRSHGRGETFVRNSEDSRSDSDCPSVGGGSLEDTGESAVSSVQTYEHGSSADWDHGGNMAASAASTPTALRPVAESGIYLDPAAVTACFDCPICLDVLVIPKVLVCGHSACYFCIECLLHHASLYNEQPPSCPLCRADVPVGSARELPTNFALQTILDGYVKSAQLEPAQRTEYIQRLRRDTDFLRGSPSERSAGVLGGGVTVEDLSAMGVHTGSQFSVMRTEQDRARRRLLVRSLFYAVDTVLGAMSTISYVSEFLEVLFGGRIRMSLKRKLFGSVLTLSIVHGLLNVGSRLA